LRDIEQRLLDLEEIDQRLGIGDQVVAAAHAGKDIADIPRQRRFADVRARDPPCPGCPLNPQAPVDPVGG